MNLLDCPLPDHLPVLLAAARDGPGNEIEARASPINARHRANFSKANAKGRNGGKRRRAKKSDKRQSAKKKKPPATVKVATGSWRDWSTNGVLG